MREIKFRAWSHGVKSGTPSQKRKFGEWIFSPHMLYDEKPGDCLVWKSQGQNIEVMQYTGLTDRNGKEIFEGDIVKQTFHAERGTYAEPETYDGHHIGEVVITASKGVCMRKPLCYSEETDETTQSNQYKSVARYRCEVIGNIYENPELVTNA